MGKIIQFPTKIYDDMVYKCNCGNTAFSIVIDSNMNLYLECTECELEMTEFQLEMLREI